ncbi:LysE family translocator [Erwinia psidii]|uniref:LysE family translocator n=1 Tax=Erwinia psidii TaxID=69224 RepID=A0A3N6SHM3_9GAMM|nr:LysE family translocator [Erwinia psidii]MCX8957995.1 LysE family translocator [Erwinia psidii]MCX8962607.1 LysE family translocator [Erwinia psidii]MCX8963930.1 LysE family translocator [Erwinia psidii]RQM39423.1 LysE family translocator [Erwinia psidii]
MNLTLLGAYILSVMMLLLTPGPVVALITGTAARYGYRSAFATAVGTNGASLVLIALATLTLKGVVSLSPLWLYLTGVAGSLYIGHAALQSLLPAPGKGDAGMKVPASHRGGFLKGFMTGIANPKDILFFIAFFPQFIAVTRDFSTSIMTLCVVWIFFDFAILTLYILTVKRWMPSRYGKTIELISSLVLLGIALGGVIYNVLAIAEIIAKGPL